MAAKRKDQAEILKKLGIDALNEMQVKTHEAISANPEVVLLSPTGTGKTLAFLLPIFEALDPKSAEIQALILAPSRELAIQIGNVAKEMGSGCKVNTVYGGRSASQDRVELRHTPAVLIGTPGRIADHIRNEGISTDGIRTLVLDEFDKSLEVGFEDEMQEIMDALPKLHKKVLTSATQKSAIPRFLRIKEAKRLNFIDGGSAELTLKTVLSAKRDKLDALERLLGHVGTGRGIIFCNLKESIANISDFLDDKEYGHACFSGDLEQIDRERSLIKFRNGTCRLLVATDLAARGIDVPELDFIIHYELPPRKDEFIHRNGRTARMNSEGTAYLMKWKSEDLPEFADDAGIQEVRSTAEAVPSGWETLHISAGRKDKISKGDIAGLFFKQGQLNKEELGVIELQRDCAYVAVPTRKTRKLIEALNNSRLKKTKVRISILD